MGNILGSLISNVVEVELVSLVMKIPPEDTKAPHKIKNYPYLLLTIPEIGGVYEGTNDNVSNSFHKIMDYSICNNFLKFLPADTDRGKIFNPRVALNKLTIKITTPDGEVLDLGEKSKFTPQLTQEQWKQIDTENTKYEEYIDKLKDSNGVRQDKDNWRRCDNANNSIVLRITVMQRSLDTVYLDRRDG